MIAATLHGPSYTTIDPGPDSIEILADLGDAVTTLLSRYTSGNYSSHHVDYLDGSDECVLFPAFGEGTYFQCYELPEDFTVSDGNIEQVMAAVHDGAPDYTLTLEYVGDRISVTVVPA